MKRIFVILILTLTILKVNAQNEIDALRYSQNFYAGTARFAGMGGAFGALGSDFSTLSINPAGIGLFKTSEFTFTPSFYIANTSSSFNGSVNDDNKYNFNLGNIGFVYDFYKRGKFAEGNGWKDIQFGFGINRLNNYNNRMIIDGFSANSTMMNQYIDWAKGYKPADLNVFDTQLAYQTYLINPTGDSTQYDSPVKGNVTQRKTLSASGSTNEFVITLGGNYSDKFYLGATIGFPFIKYSEQSTYREFNQDSSVHNFNSFTVNDDLTTSGAGINVKLGMIYRPNNFVRLGVALHTPTYYYSMQDQWSRKISSDMGVDGKYSTDPSQGTFDYQITTPMRMIGSLAFLIGDMGLVSADYEFVDYSDARLRADNEEFFNQNEKIQEKYTSTANIRVGTEWRLNPVTLRAGYGIYGSPFKTTINDGKRTVYSFGLGFKEKQYYIDFAYSYAQQKEDYYFYDDAKLSPVKNTLTGSSIMMTLGFKY